MRWIHLSALQKATRLATEDLAPAERQALARAMLADEAFALHFLEDAYAAGHVAGTWGDVSQRKGTHDYYNEAGLEVFTWERSGQSVVLMGDAHMRPEDAQIAAARRARQPGAADRPRVGPGHSFPGPAHARGAGGARPLRRVPAAPSCRRGNRASGPRRRPSCRPSRCSARRRCRASARAWAPCRAFAPRWGRSSVSPGPWRRAPSTAVTCRRWPTTARSLAPTCPCARAWAWTACWGNRATGWCSRRSACTATPTRPTTCRIRRRRVDAAGGVAAVRSRFGISTRLRMPFYLVPGDLLLLVAHVLLFARRPTPASRSPPATAA